MDENLKQVGDCIYHLLEVICDEREGLEKKASFAVLLDKLAHEHWDNSDKICKLASRIANATTQMYKLRGRLDDDLASLYQEWKRRFERMID